MVKGGVRYLLATSLFALAQAAEGSETIVYSYDSLGRLIRVEHSGTANHGTSAAYSYDSADNRTNVTVNVAGAPPPPQSAANILSTAVADSGSQFQCTTATDDVIVSDSDGVCPQPAPAPDDPPPPPSDQESR